jgi:hypothetical protein
MEGADRMTEEKKTVEPPLFLDMGFGEALARFTKTKPKEVQESIDRAKQKREPGDKAARPRPPKKEA